MPAWGARRVISYLLFACLAGALCQPGGKAGYLLLVIKLLVVPQFLKKINFFG